MKLTQSSDSLGFGDTITINMSYPGPSKKVSILIKKDGKQDSEIINLPIDKAIALFKTAVTALEAEQERLNAEKK